METIENIETLVELLFRELDESEPQREVNPSFLLRIGGLCHGMIYGGCDGAPPYLSDTLAIHHDDAEATTCGTKLITVAHSLAAEGCFDTTRAWTLTGLVELMLGALNNDDLQIEEASPTRKRQVVSSRSFAARRGVQVRVELDLDERA
ncbi:hypothetical protein [Methylobacterium oryzisoli]|uniref:hypothetical protein n=1 Tax=Methylobacterium oryzisoli TaxID=3385502 RepID=UPI003892B8D6